MHSMSNQYRAMVTALGVILFAISLLALTWTFDLRWLFGVLTGGVWTWNGMTGWTGAPSQDHDEHP